METVHVLGVAGSLRRESYNRKLLRAAQGLAPDGVAVDAFELDGIPLYNADLDGDAAPAPVREFKARIAAADALLLVTPEYNWGMPGVLKNAIDWASRRTASSPLRHKPVALMGASTGQWGTVRAQLQWRQTFVYLDAYVLPQPQALVTMAESKFDAAGALTDEPTRGHVRKLLEALAAWTRRLAAGAAG